MKFSRIILVILFVYNLISCNENSNEKHNTEPKIKSVPSTEYQKTEKSIPKLDRQKPVQKHLDKEIKKKKLKKTDTLKPIVAIP